MGLIIGCNSNFRGKSGSDVPVLPPEPNIPGPEIPKNDPLTFYKLDDGQGIIRLDKHGNFSDIRNKVINYQINDNDWQVYSWDDNGVGLEIHINKGDYLRFKGDSYYLSLGTDRWYQFYTYGLYKCGGNTMSLLNYRTDISQSNLNNSFFQNFLAPTMLSL